MIIAGKPIANRILDLVTEEISALDFSPKIALIKVGSHPAIDSFVAIKKRSASRVGIELVQYELEEGATTQQVLDEIDIIVRAEAKDGRKLYQGLIVQLPLPEQIDSDVVLGAIPAHLDIDVLSPAAQESMYRDGVLPPVVGAVREVLRKLRRDISRAKVLVVGEGRLVGKPLVEWFQTYGINPVVVTERSGDLVAELAQAEIVISGVGKPGLITADMVHAGQVLIDAGTAESGGVVAGDIHPDCIAIVDAMTPVPGGLGPIAVAVLFQNFLTKVQLGHVDDLE